MIKRRSAGILVFALIFGIAGSAPAAETSLTPKDKKFLQQAASGGLMEVELGQMAQQKAKAPEVKEFGSRMLTDHGKANEELKALIAKKDAGVAAELSGKHKKTVDKLSQAADADFDKTYMTEMVKDHAEDVASFSSAARTAKDPDVKSWIEKTLPVLKQHLEQAKEVGKKLGVDVAKAEREGRKNARGKSK